MKNPTLEKLVVALDLENSKEAFCLVESLGDLVEWYKLGPVLLTHSGFETIRFLHQNKKKIFIDLKLHDTPNVVARTVAQFAEMGIQMLTIHTQGGRRMVKAASQACRGSELSLIGITLLTSHDPNETPVKTETLVKLALEERLSGVMCSAKDLALCRSLSHQDFILATAGIRPAQHPVYQDDQLFTATPQEAINWGANLLVVGRPITLSRNPKEVVLKFMEN